MFCYRPCFAAVGGVVACFFCAKKKRRKKRRVGLAAVLCWWTSERMRVRQVKRMCDRRCPHASLLRVGGRDCFSRHHV